jgi:hypothetical protein
MPLVLRGSEASCCMVYVCIAYVYHAREHGGPNWPPAAHNYAYMIFYFSAWVLDERAFGCLFFDGHILNQELYIYSKLNLVELICKHLRPNL